MSRIAGIRGARGAPAGLATECVVRYAGYVLRRVVSGERGMPEDPTDVKGSRGDRPRARRGAAFGPASPLPATRGN